MKYRVDYSEAAKRDLAAIFRRIAEQSSSETAERFVMAIYNYCLKHGVDLILARQI